MSKKATKHFIVGYDSDGSTIYINTKTMRYWWLSIGVPHYMRMFTSEDVGVHIKGQAGLKRLKSYIVTRILL